MMRLSSMKNRFRNLHDSNGVIGREKTPQRGVFRCTYSGPEDLSSLAVAATIDALESTAGSPRLA